MLSMDRVVALGMGREKENSFRSEKQSYLESVPDEVLELIYKMATNQREKFVREFIIGKTQWKSWPDSVCVNLYWEKCGFTIDDGDITEVEDLWEITTGQKELNVKKATSKVEYDKAYSNMIRAFRPGQHKNLYEEDTDKFISNMKTLIKNYEEDESYNYFPHENQMFVEIFFRIIYHHITAEDRETILNIIPKNQYRDTHSSGEHLLEMFYNKELDVANTIGLMIDQYLKRHMWWRGAAPQFGRSYQEKYNLIELFCKIDFGSNHEEAERHWDTGSWPNACCNRVRCWCDCDYV